MKMMIMMTMIMMMDGGDIKHMVMEGDDHNDDADDIKQNV